MNTYLTALIVFGCLVGAVLLGRTLRRLLPEDHLTADSRDTIKLAMGLVATMTALVLGLLVSSAKGSYDTERSEVILMASKVDVPRPSAGRLRTRSCWRAGASFATRSRKRFGKCGPEKCAARHTWLPTCKQVMLRTVPLQASFTTQRHAVSIKSQATTLAVDVAQIRSLLVAQSVPSISKPMLIILVSWLVVIFLGFSVLAPPNATTIFALMVSALAVSGAIFLILELDEPFGGLIGISSEPMLNALHQLAQ